MNKIQKQHFALIIKYTGISFITGGISHGFFSGERQIVTSIIGILFFVVGTLLEQKSGKDDYSKIILFSALLAISIGAFTGGLQHFPDSPGRSIWIVPLGFILSVYSYISLENTSVWEKKYITYMLIGFIVSVIISVIFYLVVANGIIFDNITGHSH